MPTDAFLRASKDYCFHCSVISDLKRRARRCEFRERPDHECGDPGIPECRYGNGTPEDEWCSACKERKANEPLYKIAIRKRSMAKQRMLRQYRKMKQSD